MARRTPSSSSTARTPRVSRSAPADQGRAEQGPSSRTILEAASALLLEGGLAAITMRRLAEAVGTSTMVLYTRFGSRDAVLEALLTEGFARFANALADVDDADPVVHLRVLGRAYRRFGLEYPAAYRLMWGEKWQVSATDAAPHGRRAFASLVIAVTRVLAQRDRSAREAEPLALCVWSAVHGFVALELSGGLPPEPSADHAYERVLDFVIAGVLTPSSSLPSSSTTSSSSFSS